MDLKEIASDPTHKAMHVFEADPRVSCTQPRPPHSVCKTHATAFHCTL